MALGGGENSAGCVFFGDSFRVNPNHSSGAVFRNALRQMAALAHNSRRQLAPVGYRYALATDESGQRGVRFFNSRRLPGAGPYACGVRHCPRSGRNAELDIQRPSNTICDYASVAPGSCAPPADLNSDGTGTDQAWRSFIYQLASHITELNRRAYSPVTTYEMWNEFSRNTESWTGSQAQMVRLSQDAYCILKGVGTIAATGENCAAQTFHVPAIGILLMRWW